VGVGVGVVAGTVMIGTATGLTPTGLGPGIGDPCGAGEPCGGGAWPLRPGPTGGISLSGDPGVLNCGWGADTGGGAL
jgi:hypothetical protein